MGALCRCQDSNLDLEFRKLLFYPLNYSGRTEARTHTAKRKGLGERTLAGCKLRSC